MRKISTEHHEKGDILMADFVDHYNNLTLKSIFTVKYFTTNVWQVREIFVP